MGKTYLISDEHYFHSRILFLSRRPFKNIWEMNEKIVENHNKIIKGSDEVFHLGDFALGSRKWHQEILSRLKGKHYLILGNHDGTRKKNLEIGFLDVYRQLELPNGILLIHDAKKARDTYSRVIHGHCHLAWKHKRVGNRQFINVGVDVRDFKPVLLDDVIKEFN